MQTLENNTEVKEKSTLIKNYIKSQSYQKEFKDLMLLMLDIYGVEIFNLCGIGEQLDLNKAVKNMVKADNTANGSIDSNANVGATTSITIMHEISKPHILMQSYYRLWKWLKKNRSLEVANKFVKSQLIGEFYVNDMHYNTYIQPYCFNHSCLYIATQGLVGVNSKNNITPPKYLRSFFDIMEAYLLISGASTAGATGISNLLVVASVFLKKMINNNFSDSHVCLKSEEDCWTYFKEELTSFIYKLNQDCRGNQSLFTNVSIYDKNFLNTIIPETILFIDGNIYDTDLETVQRVQEIYLDVMNEEAERVVHTFPVTTACFASKYNEETGKNEILDQDFLDFICRKNEKNGFINMYSGDTATLSSCCFDGKTLVEVQDYSEPKTFEEIYKEACEKLNFEYYVKQGNTYKLATIVKIPKLNKRILKIITSSGKNIICTEDHRLITKSLNFEESIKLAKDVVVGDILSVHYEYGDIDISDFKNRGYVEHIYDITEDYNNDFVYCFTMHDKNEDWFTLANKINVKNCRLRSDKNNAFFNSFGGASDSIGSMGVVCINLPQLAFKYKNNVGLFKSDLKDIVNLAQEVNYAKRCLLKHSIKKGHLPLYTNGYMDLSKQFSTLGFIGLYEACEIYGKDITTPEGLKLAQEILHIMEETNEKFSEEHKIPCNMEGIPGENTCVKLALKDKVLGFNDKYNMYSNQFIPLSKRCNLLDRIKLSSAMDKYCSGGSIMHITVDSKMSLETMKDIVSSIIESGVKYFAFNYEINQCKDCGKIFVGKTKTCISCGGDNIDRYMRVVGFLTKKSSWSETRQLEDRQYYNF